jgi:hypothetical protein
MRSLQDSKVITRLPAASIHAAGPSSQRINTRAISSRGVAVINISSPDVMLLVICRFIYQAF